uniref:Uncharacterized protein n=1 Tax=Cannabis sativa TaxID=3483 RepID=A0A803PKF5_CANSA
MLTKQRCVRSTKGLRALILCLILMRLPPVRRRRYMSCIILSNSPFGHYDANELWEPQLQRELVLGMDKSDLYDGISLSHIAQSLEGKERALCQCLANGGSVSDASLQIRPRGSNSEGPTCPLPSSRSKGKVVVEDSDSSSSEDDDMSSNFRGLDGGPSEEHFLSWMKSSRSSVMAFMKLSSSSDNFLS